MLNNSKVPIIKELRIFRPSDSRSDKVFRSALSDLPFLSELEGISRSRVNGRSISSDSSYFSSSRVLNASNEIEISKSYLADHAKALSLINWRGGGTGAGI